jgi:hypothetical protein
LEGKTLIVELENGRKVSGDRVAADAAAGIDVKPGTDGRMKYGIFG